MALAQTAQSFFLLGHLIVSDRTVFTREEYCITVITATVSGY